jgi:hypothetical protein
MAENSIEIRVSARELERARYLVAIAFNRDDGEGVEGMKLRVEVDDQGSLGEEGYLKEKEFVTTLKGYAFIAWYEWPRGETRYDRASVVTIRWDDENIGVFLDHDDD